MFQVCTLERIPYIFLCNDAIDIYIILTESHDQGLSNKPIYNLRNTLVNEIHVEQSKCPKHLKPFWGHCTSWLPPLPWMPCMMGWNGSLSCPTAAILLLTHLHNFVTSSQNALAWTTPPHICCLLCHYPLLFTPTGMCEWWPHPHNGAECASVTALLFPCLLPYHHPLPTLFLAAQRQQHLWQIPVCGHVGSMQQPWHVHHTTRNMHTLNTSFNHATNLRKCTTLYQLSQVDVCMLLCCMSTSNIYSDLQKCPNDWYFLILLTITYQLPQI